ncbi:hypothetical protein PMZ80_000857 [Knufia obscura]|uniref:Uncharacterized protein n=2 Tax=Knufia TaxID=430999 RepID=A0AAN8I353_9EURO|nr:hypothetical protein PMZ80_000857 [Knufia obscura]KAK5949879.1 hypothetical protein OHC33_009064 [Knufia fluminis]
MPNITDVKPIFADQGISVGSQQRILRTAESSNTWQTVDIMDHVLDNMFLLIETGSPMAEVFPIAADLMQAWLNEISRDIAYFDPDSQAENAALFLEYIVIIFRGISEYLLEHSNTLMGQTHFYFKLARTPYEGQLVYFNIVEMLSKAFDISQTVYEDEVVVKDTSNADFSCFVPQAKAQLFLAWARSDTAAYVAAAHYVLEKRETILATADDRRKKAMSEIL